MADLQYYIIDTETTGLKTNYHEMTEIGIIRVKDRVQLHRQIRCNYPERANFDALAITKKTLADLDRGHERDAVVAECEKFFEEDGTTPAHRIIVAHNAAFDRRFLQAMWEQSGRAFPASLWLCTMALYRNWAKAQGIKGGAGLHAALDGVGIKKFSEAHNAKVDSRNTYLLHRGLVEDKKVDYLPFIKTAVHEIVDPTAALDEEELGLDPSLLDI